MTRHTILGGNVDVYKRRNSSARPTSPGERITNKQKSLDCTTECAAD